MDLYNLRIDEIIYNLGISMIKKSNIVAVGRGRKIINGYMTNEPTLTFLVEKKLSSNLIDRKNIIPKYVGGALTDVIEVGFCVNDIEPKHKENVTPFANNKPALGGGLVLFTENNILYKATLAYAVTNKKTRENIYFLTSGHVLSPGGTFKRMRPLNYALGLEDSNNQWLLGLSDKVFTSKTDPKTGENIVSVDAALGFVGLNKESIREVLLPGLINKTLIKGIQTAKAGDDTYKYGGMSKYNEGAIMVVNSTGMIKHNENKYDVYTKQIISNEDYKHGDAGSLGVIKGTNKAFGILSYGTTNVAVYSDIRYALDEFGVEFLT